MPQLLQRLTLPGHKGPVPVIVLASREPGPSVVVTANVHGDEVTGLGAVHQLLQRLDRELLRGTVTFYPSLNPEGMQQGTRVLQLEGQDLNRLFPGDPKGTPAERYANAIWRDLAARKPDAVLDLHADAPASIPYVLMDRVCRPEPAERRALEGRIRALAQATGFTAVHDYPQEEYVRFQLDRSLSGAVVQHLGVPAITLESGPRLHLAPKAVADMTEAALGALHLLGLVARPAAPHPTRVGTAPLRRAPGPRATTAGVLHSLVQAGEPFQPEQPFAELRSLEGRLLERLTASTEGYVLSLPERAWLTPGASTATCAIPEAP